MEATMAGKLQALPTADESPMQATSITVDERKRKLSLILANKVEQGYTIESQTDTDAVLETRGRSRWFGLRGRAPGSRQQISIDGQGRSTTRKCSAYRA